MKRKINLILVVIFFSLLFSNNALANLKEELLNKYKAINTLSFDFTQKIGDKIEIGNCYIKYPLLMKCEYPKKKKLIIANGRTLAIVKNRYKKIYQYPLKKTPLFHILNKENILNIIQNYEPTNMNNDIIEYELTDTNSNKINIFFDKNSLLLSGWKTIDTYSNEVSFLIENIETNIFFENKIFKIPKEEDF